MATSSRSSLPELMLRDERRLRRRLEGARKIKNAEAREQALREIDADIEAAAGRLADRRRAVPKLSYPAELPVSQRRRDILEAIPGNPLVIVAGETGSGETTPLPPIRPGLGPRG